MISWINGDLVDLWQTDHKFYILLNCQGLGYEIQILEFLYINLKNNQLSNKNITLWIKHIKKEDSDLLFGFTSRDQKNFFIEILKVRGVGSQIAMGILNKFSISELNDAINTENKKLICSVPGIGQKMSERLILELKSKLKKEFQINKEKTQDVFQIKDNEIEKLLEDLNLTLSSLNYTKSQIKSILPLIIEKTHDFKKKEKKISFENLLKLAMNYLDNNSSNIVR